MRSGTISTAHWDKKLKFLRTRCNEEQNNKAAVWRLAQEWTSVWEEKSAFLYDLLIKMHVKKLCVCVCECFVPSAVKILITITAFQGICGFYPPMEKKRQREAGEKSSEEPRINPDQIPNPTRKVERRRPDRFWLPEKPTAHDEVSWSHVTHVKALRALSYFTTQICTQDPFRARFGGGACNRRFAFI